LWNGARNSFRFEADRKPIRSRFLVTLLLETYWLPNPTWYYNCSAVCENEDGFAVGLTS
jgi:hypothetical protein